MSRPQPSTPAPHVSFVVVNWNQRQLTLDCLESLHQQRYPDFSVVLVDNGSRDGSVSAVRSVYPDIIVIENEDNLGIATANNVGIKYGLCQGADYVFLLNNDTLVAGDMLGILVDAAESAPDVAATGPTIMYHDPPQRIWSAGAHVDVETGTVVRLQAECEAAGIETDPVQVNLLSSCGVCIKRVAFQDVGLWDDRFFIYYDEVDWFSRAEAAGWRSLYIPSAKMWHRVSATMGTTSPATEYYSVRNRMLYLSKNLHGFARWKALFVAAGSNLLTAAAYTVKSQNGRRVSRRDARLFALRDAALGRWGEMGPDVAAICNPDSR